MDAALVHGDGGVIEDEDNGEEMSDSSVCSYDDPPHHSFNGARAETALQERLAAEAALQERLAAEAPQATENTASHRKRRQPQKP